MAAPDPPDFTAFFRALWNYDPFPWQCRLAQRLRDGCGWPDLCDLPTSAGKTALLDVAVWCLAAQAGFGVKRTAPLRIVFCVDRRTIVDQAHERAAKIAAAIDEARSGVLLDLRERLASYGRDRIPLATALLRGGIPRDGMWARTPDQPTVIVSTVDQVGSRLLYRGYGVSDRMQPVHAGLLGSDVLYLLDEVHLSHPFRETLQSIRDYRGNNARSPFVVVEMSATPGPADARDVFSFDAADRAHPILRKRMSARKPTVLVKVASGRLLAEIEKRATSLVAQPGATVAVVVNRVATARALHEALADGLGGDVDVHLVTGRMRPHDRDALERHLVPRVRAGRLRDGQQRPCVVVGTQCIEAGADFDFDALVTECASLDALRQRFGRLDRLGDLDGDARGVVVAHALDDDAVYGEATAATWAWLTALATTRKPSRGNRQGAPEPTIDFGTITVPDDAAQSGLLAPRPVAPVLLPSVLDALAQTAPLAHASRDVATYLHGLQAGPADVSVVWRADLTSELLATPDAAFDVVGALRPCAVEAMSVPFLSARRWLAGEAEPDSYDVEGAREFEGKQKPSPVREPRSALAWRSGDRSTAIDARALRPGDTIVVPTSYGGIASGTWSPADETPVADVAELSALRQRGRAVLRLHPAVCAGLDLPAPPIPVLCEDENASDDRATVRAWLASISTDSFTGDLVALVGALKRDGRHLMVERVSSGSGEYYLATASRPIRRGADGDITTEDDRASFTGVRVSLVSHLAGVGRLAEHFAAAAGLPSEIVSDLLLAGELHDTGKVDPRFQAMLCGGDRSRVREPLAKSAMPMSDRRVRDEARRRAGYPRGARHEALSVALAESADELRARAYDWSLVVHAVASHHGHARPLMPAVLDADPRDVKWSHDGVAMVAACASDLAALDVGERFWVLVARFGWWGLAEIEAALRLADHRRSEDEQSADAVTAR